MSKSQFTFSVYSHDTEGYWRVDPTNPNGEDDHSRPFDTLSECRDALCNYLKMMADHYDSLDTYDDVRDGLYRAAYWFYGNDNHLSTDMWLRQMHITIAITEEKVETMPTPELYSIVYRKQMLDEFKPGDVIIVVLKRTDNGMQETVSGLYDRHDAETVIIREANHYIRDVFSNEIVRVAQDTYTVYPKNNKVEAYYGEVRVY